MRALVATVKSSLTPMPTASSMLATLAAEKSASPPLVVTIRLTTAPPVVVLITVSKLSSAVSVVAVPKPSMSSRPTLTDTFCVPLTSSRLTLGAALMFKIIAAVRPCKLTVVLLVLLEVKVELITEVDAVSMPSPA